jgi:hypothetical protein
LMNSTNVQYGYSAQAFAGGRDENELSDNKRESYSLSTNSLIGSFVL